MSIGNQDIISIKPFAEFTEDGYFITAELNNCKVRYLYTDVLFPEKLDVKAELFIDNELVDPQIKLIGKSAETVGVLVNVIMSIADDVMEDFYKMSLGDIPTHGKLEMLN